MGVLWHGMLNYVKYEVCFRRLVDGLRFLGLLYSRIFFIHESKSGYGVSWLWPVGGGHRMGLLRLDGVLPWRWRLSVGMSEEDVEEGKN